ncbi:MAG: hypothetical protein ACRD4Y_04450, partial [Candidatus Acidiferrales bacterium]
ALEEVGRKSAVNAFTRVNEYGSYVALQGGNPDFRDPGLAYLCKDHGRCDNGLDFSHGDTTFHRDTANVWKFPLGTFVHFGVDFVRGNIINDIPR